MGPMMRFGASASKHTCDDENTEEAHLCVTVNAAEERWGFWIDAIIPGKQNAQHRATLCLLRDHCRGE